MSEENTLSAEQAVVPWTSNDWEPLNTLGVKYPITVPVIVSGPYTPEYATDGASGFDIRAWRGFFIRHERRYSFEIEPHETRKIPTGLRFAIPRGYEIQIRPRSGLSSRGLVAQFGTVDSDYRGEVSVILHNNTPRPILVEHGDRIAQGIIAPVIRAVFVRGEVTDDTERGSNGFGSTGA